jgi:hypothetical protein
MRITANHDANIGRKKYVGRCPTLISFALTGLRIYLLGIYQIFFHHIFGNL